MGADTVTTPADLRACMGEFATGVTVITTIDAGGEPLGTTANAVTSLSLEPPLVLACLDARSRTLEGVRASGAFALNILRADQRATSDAFARTGHAGAWATCRRRAGASGVPLVEGCLAWVECAVENVVAGGDHFMLVGAVRSAERCDEPAQPLLFHRGRYA